MELNRYNNGAALGVLPDIALLYGEVYRVPPYCEGPDDVEAFVAGMPRRVEQPAFRMITASLNGRLVGFAFGHQLTSDTKWWTGATTEIDAELTREIPGRTFALIELAVQSKYRHRGIAKAMHDALLKDASEERTTLLVRPEAVVARTAYDRWGYIKVGSIRPWPDAPLYHVMILDLHQ
jgi:ribosomal protein S18 acetylase RimI-like enzyme